MNDPSFSHRALSQPGGKQLIYTAMSKHLFYFRAHISRYVLEQGAVPLNPFMLFDYFLMDTVERDIVRNANNTVVLRSDEIWVFGPISNGVFAEIVIAKKTNKPIRYFKIVGSLEIIPVSPEEIEMEGEVEEFRSLLFS